MKKHQYLLLILLFGLIQACVPTKKITYLQNEDKDEIKAYDEETSSYAIKKETYTLQSGDIISLRVASVTGSEYNFIKQYEENLGIIRRLDQYELNRGEKGSANSQMARTAGPDGMAPIVLDQQNTGFVLDLNGNLELPQIGLLELSGLSIPEAELKIKTALEGYFETPMVRIQLLNYHFTIVGEVNKEGRYTSFDPEVTIFDAITLASNLTEFADRANIKIIREVNNEKKVIYLNTLDEKTLAADNYFIQRGDLIVVPPLKARTANMYTIPNINRTLGIVGTALSVLALILTLNK